VNAGMDAKMHPRGCWGASAQTHHVRADAGMRPCGYTMSTRMRFLPCPRVNADAGGCPDEKDVWTDIFIQLRPL
jgi:hypothetical protein